MYAQPSPRPIAALIAEAINTELRAAIDDQDNRCAVSAIRTVALAIADKLHLAKVPTPFDPQWFLTACAARHFGANFLAGRLAAGNSAVTVTMTAGDTAYAPGTTKKVLTATGNGVIVYSSPFGDACWQADTSAFVGYLLRLEPDAMQLLENPAAFRAHRTCADAEAP